MEPSEDRRGLLDGIQLEVTARQREAAYRLLLSI